MGVAPCGGRWGGHRSVGCRFATRSEGCVECLSARRAEAHPLPKKRKTLPLPHVIGAKSADPGDDSTCGV